MAMALNSFNVASQHHSAGHVSASVIRVLNSENKLYDRRKKQTNFELFSRTECEVNHKHFLSLC